MRIVLVLLFLSLAAPVFAEPAISCHCFRDRAFDPARPQAVDPYLLATAGNSLLSAAFGADKKSIVQARMTGTSGEDLWIAHFAASRQGTSSAALLADRADAASWPALLGRLDPAPFGPRFAGAVVAGEGDSVLASIAVDETLAARLGMTSSQLSALRAGGASDKEAVLASFLARLSNRPAAELLAEVRSGRATWGALLEGLGIVPATVEERLRRLLR